MSESASLETDPVDGPDPVPSPRAELVRRLAGLPSSEQTHLLLGLVTEHTLAALRRARPDAAPVLDTERAFRELGLDSLALVDLHARIGAATGLALPPTIVFDLVFLYNQ